MGQPMGNGPIAPDPGDRSPRERGVLIGAVVAVGTVAVLAAGAVVAVAAGGDSTAHDAAPMSRTSAVPSGTTAPTTSAPRTTEPRITIPPLFGGESSGPGTSSYEVKVEGSGTARLITLGVPGADTVGEQQLPWSQSFSTDSFLVSVTVLAYEGSVTCSITKDGRMVSEQTTANAGSGSPVICTAIR